MQVCRLYLRSLYLAIVEWKEVLQYEELGSATATMLQEFQGAAHRCLIKRVVEMND